MACSVAGCKEPVIGQCAGYKESCGRFYCAEHSAGKLCAECAERLAKDEAAQRLYDDYLQTAKELRKRWGDKQGAGCLMAIIGPSLVTFVGAWLDGMVFKHSSILPHL